MSLNTEKYKMLHQMLDKELDMQESQGFSPVKYNENINVMNQPSEQKYISHQEQQFQKSGMKHQESESKFITFSKTETDQNYMNQLQQLKDTYKSGQNNTKQERKYHEAIEHSPMSDKYLSEQNEKELNMIAAKVQNLERQLELYQTDQVKQHQKISNKKRQPRNSQNDNSSISSNRRLNAKINSLKKSGRQKSSNSLVNAFGSLNSQKQNTSLNKMVKDYKQKYEKHKKMNIQLKQENISLQNTVQILQKKLKKIPKTNIDSQKLKENFKKSEQIRVQQKELINTMQQELDEMRDRASFYKLKLKEQKKKHN